jgi:hypothetical protein
MPLELGSGSFGTTTLDVPEGVTLTISAGGVVKSAGGVATYSQSDTLSIEGSLVAIGTVADPIVFTSIDDNSVGGSTGSGSPSRGEWNGIYFSAPVGADQLRYDVFEYAETAVSVGFLTSLSVTHSQFSYDQAAFDVSSTAVEDLALASLPCAPPYLSFVDASNDWFGVDGQPGTSFDLSSYVDELIPSVFTDLAFMSPYISASASVSINDNTIPWSLYGCKIPGTQIDFGIPMTPILYLPIYSSPASPGYPDGSPLFPQYAEKN